MKKEPAAIGAGVAAALNAIVMFALGESLSVEEQGAIVTAVTVIAGLFIRSKVSPVA